jgi:hypothetical protein
MAGIMTFALTNTLRHILPVPGSIIHVKGTGFKPQTSTVMPYFNGLPALPRTKDVQGAI